MAGVFKSLDKSDIRLTPFRAYKQYIGTSPSASYTTYSAVLSTTPIELGNDALDTVSSYYTTNGKLKDSVWRITNHLFYRDFYTNTKATFGSSDLNKQTRLLGKDAVVISIPQSNFGESIAYDTFRCIIGGTAYKDDLYGNLVDSQSRWFGEISASNVVFGLKPQRWTIEHTNLVSQSQQYHTDLYPATVRLNQVEVNYDSTIGTYFDLSQSGSITIEPYSSDISQKYNFTNTDFGIYVAFSGSISGSGNFTIVEKKAQTEVFGVDVNGNVLTNTIYRYPYCLTYSSESNKFIFTKSNGHQTLVYTSSNVAPEADEVLLTRSGSTYYLKHSYVYTNDSFTDTIGDSGCTNLAPIRIGNNELFTSSSNLYISNASFFDTFITTQSAGMFSTLNGRLPINDPYKVVGNVFHKHGIITITDPSLVTQIQNTPSDLSMVTYRGTTTIYENEVSCTVSPNEFGLSNNPTLHQYNATKNQYEFKPFISSSDFRPFVTQVGLYDDYGNLLVVGKLTQPIQLPSNVDTTFIIRYDR
jgi:hypothetical protein